MDDFRNFIVLVSQQETELVSTDTLMKNKTKQNTPSKIWNRTFIQNEKKWLRFKKLKRRSRKLDLIVAGTDSFEYVFIDFCICVLNIGKRKLG